MSILFSLLEVMMFLDISISQRFLSIEDAMAAETKDVNDHVLQGCMRENSSESPLL